MDVDFPQPLKVLPEKLDHLESICVVVSPEDPCEGP